MLHSTYALGLIALASIYAHVAFLLTFASLPEVQGLGVSSTAHSGNRLIQVNAKTLTVLRQAPSPAAPEGRWLFGSLTCPLDELPVDQMLQHQLQQSAQRPFDTRMLFTTAAGDRASQLQRAGHEAALRRVREMRLVDEVVNLEDLDASELAKSSMASETAKAFVALKAYMDYNRAMAAFLAKCLSGYDHCAWLDSDIFVHRGSIPWVDEAVQKQMVDPRIAIGIPSFVPSGGDGRSQWFSSRYFIYHTEGLRKVLPLQGIPTDTFETLVHENLRRIGKWKEFSFQSGHDSGSWVIHPPDSSADLRHILKSCVPTGDGLSALIAIVEHGGEKGDKAYTWRGEEENENMDVDRWSQHMREHCADHSFAKSLLEAFRKATPAHSFVQLH